jgi:hypothetical protein
MVAELAPGARVVKGFNQFPPTPPEGAPLIGLRGGARRTLFPDDNTWFSLPRQHGNACRPQDFGEQ